MKITEIPPPLWRRVFAYLIDSFIVSMIIFFPLRNFYPESPNPETISEMISFFSSDFTGGVILISLIAAILTILYWAVLEFKISQSIGKMVMGIKVISTKDKLTFSQCIIRNLTKISTLLLLLDTAYMFKSGNQRFLDTIANTQVVMKNKKK